MMFQILFGIFILSGYVDGLPLENSEDYRRYFSPNIIGGENAPKGYAPHMAALLVGDAVTMLACGGSIVLPTLVLTAAHCIEPFVGPRGFLATFHALVGTQNWRKGGTAVGFKDYHIHPDWDPRPMKNDIGFLVLKEAVPLSGNVKLAALNYDWVEGNEDGFVTGWGLLNSHVIPHNLQILEVNILTPQRCSNAVDAANAIWWNRVRPVDPAIEICSLHSFGRGLCNGDSGSPLISRKTGTQVGIASWVFMCARGAPDVHVRISGFKNYIEDFMRKYR